MTTIKASLQIGHNRKSKIIGEISLNSTHLVFTPLDSSSSILSIPYSDLKSIHRKVPLILSLSDLEYPFHIFCKSLLFLRFHLHSISQADLFYSTIQKNMNIQNINQLACFSFSPQVPFDKDLGWSIYNFQLEYSRMGLDSHPTKWRISKINQDFSFSQSYPRQFIVPAKISDTVLRHIGNFRSKSRIPVLSYFHSKNFTSITRSSQPMVGLKQARSLQDEKLIETIFMQSLPEFPLLENSSNVILDARPTANAMGQMALGAGTENTDNYKHCKLVFAGIDNIHAVRDSQNKLIDVLLGVDGPIPKHLLDKSQWLKHLHNILDGTMQIVSNIHLNNANVLVHCSDGWDRTAQLCSLAKICLDPYFRTVAGFQVLIEQEWISFGFKFSDRCGHFAHPSSDQSGENQSTNNSVMAQLEAQGTPESEIKRQLETSESSRVNSLAPKEISPIFTQFLDAVYQIWIQFPQMFEFNEKFLIYINTHIYSGQFGTFLFNSDSQRAAFLKEGKSLKESTYSIWGYMETVEQDILNPIYVSPEMIRNRKIKGKEKSPVGNAPLLPLKTVGTPGSSTEEGTVIFPSSNELKYWLGLFMRNDLDGVEIVDVETLTGSLNSSLNATMGATMKALRSVVDAIDFDDGSTESLVIEEELKKVEKEKVVVRAPSPSRSVSPVKKKEIEMMDMVDL